MAEYGQTKSILEIPLEEQDNRILYNVPGYNYGVPEKVNFWSDDAQTQKEKLSLDYIPYLEEPKTTEAKKAAQYGFSSALSGAAYHVSGIPGWTDTLADWTLEKLGHDPDQWKFEYVNGHNAAIEEGIITQERHAELQSQFAEKRKFKESLDNNSFKNFAFHTLAGIDSAEDYMRDVAISLGPEHLFHLDQGYAPDTIGEQVIAGLTGAPVMIAEYGAYTAAAIATLAAVGIPGAVVGGSALAFGTVGFLGSYEQPWSKVFSNTAMGAVEGAAFGSVGKLSGWATRSVALGAIGAASAKMHGGGTTEMISGAITLAGLGFAGPMIGLKRPGETAWGPGEGRLTFTPLHAVAIHDASRLNAHIEPVVNFNANKGKGYHVEIEPLPFKFEKLTKEELTKRSKAEKAMEDLGNIELLTKTKGTQKAIDAGKDAIPFKRVTKETKKEELDYSKGEKEVFETVNIPRDQVIVNGKYLDLTVHINARTKNIIPKRKTPKVDKSRTEFEGLTESLSARTSNTRVAAENVSIARDLANTHGFKFLKDGAKIEVKLSQIQRIAKSRKKEDAWAKSLLAKMLELKGKKEINLNSRLKKYETAASDVLKRLSRFAAISTKLKSDPGESPFKHWKQLENALIDPLTGKIKIDKVTGKAIENDLTGSLKGIIGSTFNFAQKFGLPAKLAGDPSKNAFLRYVTTKVKHYQLAVDAGKSDILYKRLIDPKFKPDQARFVAENPGVSQGGIFYAFGNIAGKIKTFKDKQEGAWTAFELLLKEKGKKGGIESANKIIKAMVQRELDMQKRAQLAAGGKKASKQKVEKLLLSKRDDGAFKFQMTYDRMAVEYKLSKEEIAIIKNLDRGLAEARIAHNKAVNENPEVGATIIAERPNYFPRTWIGRHRLYIKEPGKEGRVVHAIAGRSELEVKGIFETFIKKNPEFKKYEVSYELKSDINIGGRRQNTELAFEEGIRYYDKTNPDIAIKLKEAQANYLAKKGFGARKVARKDTGGYVGTGKEGRRLIDEFQEAYLGYIDGALRGAESIRFRAQTEPLLGGRSKFQDLIPQQVEFARKYVDNAFGRDASYLAKKGDKIIETIADSALFKKFSTPNSFQRSIQVANSLTLHKALLFFNPRFLYSQIVQPYQMGIQRLRFMQVEYGIKGDIGKAIVEGSYLPFKPTPEFRQLVVEALERGVIDAKFLREFGIDLRTGKRIETVTEEMFMRNFERATGKRMSEIAERHSRLTALAMNYSFLKSGKYDVANGKDAMFKTAQWMTDNMMVEYNFTNRPLMYTHQGMGTVGSLFGLFKTFQHNYYGQVAQYARTYAKGIERHGGNLRSLKGLKGFAKGSFSAEASPLLLHAVSMVMTAGLFGIMAVEQVDFLLRQMNKSVQFGLKSAGVKDPEQYRIPEYTETVLKLDIPMEQKFGVPSALIGADVSSTLAAPGLGPGDILSLPTLDFLFGLTSKTSEGAVGNSFNVLTKMATGMYSDADMYKLAKSTMPVIFLAEVERRFAGISTATMFGKDRPFVPSGVTQPVGKYYEFKNNRWVVRNPYKGMRGGIERDIGGFWKRYLGGRSFEEAIILKSIWQSTKLSRNHKDKVNALVTAAASDALNGYMDQLMLHTDMAKDMGYTQEEFFKKVINRMESMNNTVLSRLTGYSKRYNMTRDDFIRSVLHNNNISLAYPVGSQ